MPDSAQASTNPLESSSLSPELTSSSTLTPITKQPASQQPGAGVVVCQPQLNRAFRGTQASADLRAQLLPITSAYSMYNSKPLYDHFSPTAPASSGLSPASTACYPVHAQEKGDFIPFVTKSSSTPEVVAPVVLSPPTELFALEEQLSQLSNKESLRMM